MIIWSRRQVHHGESNGACEVESVLKCSCCSISSTSNNASCSNCGSVVIGVAISVDMGAIGVAIGVAITDQ